MSIQVLSSGPLLSVQDLGWRGHAHLGLGGNGVLDRAATQLANALVGNSAKAAVLEITWGGAGLRFTQEHVIALSGADLRAELDGRSLANWSAHRVSAGSVLRFATPRMGARSYLSVAGGLDVPLLLGSHATELRSGFGGGFSRALQRGDELAVLAGPVQQPVTGYWLAAHWLYPLRPLRILSGAQFNDLDCASRAALRSGEFQIGPHSDRMGLRLDCSLNLERRRELISAPLVAGTVQLPADGTPIVLTRAHQTTGGYPAIAHVISADLDRLAQLKPGSRVRFELTDLAHAQALATRRSTALEQLCACIAQRQTKRQQVRHSAVD
jgi:antagonist of KipI